MTWVIQVLLGGQKMRIGGHLLLTERSIQEWRSAWEKVLRDNDTASSGGKNHEQ